MPLEPHGAADVSASERQRRRASPPGVGWRWRGPVGHAGRPAERL